jgi:hypothetical protein
LRIYKLSTAILISIIFLLGDKASGADSGALMFKAGLGYDFLSQQYFVDSVRLSGGDSLVQLSLLENDYLDDKKALVSFRYRPGLSGQYSVEGSWEQTPELFRATGRGFLTSGDYRNQLQAECNIDIKKRYRGETKVGEEMTIVDGAVRLKRTLNDNFSGRFSVVGESVNFDTLAAYIYNYSRLRGELELNYTTHNFDLIYAILSGERRDVPDTSQLDYDIIRGGVGFTGSLLNGMLDAELILESRKYNQADNPDNYFLTSFQSDLRLPLTDRFGLKGIFELEYYDFNEGNYINEDYDRTHLGLHSVWEKGDFSISLGPEFEYLTINSISETDDDYFEYFAFAGFDYFRDGLFLFFDNEFGHRNYLNNPLFYSDFVFDRLSLIGSAAIFENLNFDLLLSIELEWHQVDSDDSRLYLLSSSLTYSF